MTARMGPESGRTIRKKMTRSLQPSSEADSTSSKGMVDSKNVRMMMRLYVLTAVGRISAHIVLSRCSRCTMRNVGIMPPVKNIVNTNTPMNRLRP